MLKNIHKNDKMINIKATTTLAQLLAQLAPFNLMRHVKCEMMVLSIVDGLYNVIREQGFIRLL